MTANTTANGALVEEIRRIIHAAHQAGRPRPGRPRLMEQTGATDHQVKKALAALRSTDCTGDTSDHHFDHDPANQATVTNRAMHGDVSAPGAVGESGSPAAAQHAATVHQPDISTPLAVPRGTRLVVWGGFLLGLAASVLANVLDAWLPVTHQQPGWTPGLAPQIGAAVWPAALMFSVEALSRVPWPDGFWWGVARYGGAGTVAAGSAAISYGHVHHVLVTWGYGTQSAAIGPLVIDGLMVICGFALLAISRTTGPDDHRDDMQ